MFFDIKCQDCILGMKKLNELSCDICVTSPPYNLGKKYNVYNDNLKYSEYLEWCNQWGQDIKRILKKDGSFFLNVGTSSKNPFLAFDVAKVMNNFFVLQNTFHWIKNISINDNSFGHFKPINSQRYVNDTHEYIFHFTPEGKTKINRLALGVPYSDKSNVKRWAHTNGQDLRCRGNVWYIPYKTINFKSTRPHPATFPTELALNCIKIHGKKNCTVLDPFLGIGHSAYAAKESGLVDKFIGFDIDNEYISFVVNELGLEKNTENP